MPVAKIGRLSLYYEIIGQGQPLVMIRGVGSNADHWYEQVPALSQKFQLLLFDNRGIARSSDPGGSFSIRDMAADTIALMEAVGFKKAHVLGYSMGGMIAQEMALNHPQKVEGLINVRSSFSMYGAFLNDKLTNRSPLMPGIRWQGKYVCFTSPTVVQWTSH